MMKLFFRHNINSTALQMFQNHIHRPAHGSQIFADDLERITPQFLAPLFIRQQFAQHQLQGTARRPPGPPRSGR